MFYNKILSEVYWPSLQNKDETIKDNTYTKEASLLILGTPFSGKSSFVNNMGKNELCINKELISYHQIIKQKYSFIITKLCGDILYMTLYKSMLKKEHDVSLIFFKEMDTDLEIFDIWFDFSKSLTTLQSIVIINKNCVSDVSNTSHIELYCLKHNILHLCIDISNNTDLDILITLIISIIELKSENKQEVVGRSRSSSRENCTMILRELYN